MLINGTNSSPSTVSHFYSIAGIKRLGHLIPHSIIQAYMMKIDSIDSPGQTMTCRDKTEVSQESAIN